VRVNNKIDSKSHTIKKSFVIFRKVYSNFFSRYCAITHLNFIM